MAESKWEVDFRILAGALSGAGYSKEIWYIEDRYFENLESSGVRLLSLLIWLISVFGDEIRVSEIGLIFRDSGIIYPEPIAILSLTGDQAKIWYAWLLENGTKDTEPFESQVVFSERAAVKKFQKKYSVATVSAVVERLKGYANLLRG